MKADFHKWKDILGDEYVIVFKPHYLIINKYENDHSLDGFLYSISANAEINELYVLSDILITDYSSVFFDYAVLNRPIYFYMYDIDEYKGELRGFYLDIYKELPGKIYEYEKQMLSDIKNNVYDYSYLKIFNERLIQNKQEIVLKKLLILYLKIYDKESYENIGFFLFSCCLKNVRMRTVIKEKIMGIQKLILNFILTIESLIISIFKIKSNKVTFISLESDQLTSDFKLIYDQLDLNEFDVHLCLIKYHKDLWGQFLYFINCMKQLYLINTSKIVLLHDNNYVVSHFKREGVIVLQVWHACGAVKKFGNAIERQYPIANYDYVLATSSYWQKAYSEAFSIPESHVLPIGLPRTDELFDKQWLENSQNDMLYKYPFLKDKKSSYMHLPLEVIFIKVLQQFHLIH